MSVGCLVYTRRFEDFIMKLYGSKEPVLICFVIAIALACVFQLSDSNYFW